MSASNYIIDYGV